MIRARTVALFYILFASLAVLLLATTVPPLQNADEAAHAYRADQISHLGLIGTRLADGEVGGRVDSGLLTLRSETASLPFNRSAKVSRTMYVPVAWGPALPAGFPNTAIYPPFFYMPAAVMAAAARRMNIELPHALVLMRLATAAADIGIAATAIAISGNAAIWLFAILMLPMSLALSTAVSQDGPMLACVALAAALYLRVRDRAPHRRLAFMVMCLLLTLTGMARPPYAAFATLALAAPLSVRWRLGGMACILAGIMIWIGLMTPYVVLPAVANGTVSPLPQLLGLVARPWRLPGLTAATWQANGSLICRSFIGILGWLDVDLPGPYHRLAWKELALAALVCWYTGGRTIGWRDMAPGALAVLGGAGGVVLIQYMTWTALGAQVIDGIQGRYFLAPALLLGILPRRHPEPWGSNAASWLAAPVLTFPIVSIAAMMHALVQRYYF